MLSVSLREFILFFLKSANLSGSVLNPTTHVNCGYEIYTENIQFFSRNNKSVGRVLPFQYSIKNNDWHHQGINSKGDPMYEIWTSRKR